MWPLDLSEGSGRQQRQSPAGMCTRSPVDYIGGWGGGFFQGSEVPGRRRHLHPSELHLVSGANHLLEAGKWSLCAPSLQVARGRCMVVCQPHRVGGVTTAQHNEVKAYADLTHFETPYVVKMHNVHQLALSEEVPPPHTHILTQPWQRGWSMCLSYRVWCRFGSVSHS